MDYLVHTLNRGVDKRKIFMDDRDRFRFIHDLFEFNDIETSTSAYYNFLVTANPKYSKSTIGRPRAKRAPRKLLVNIHCFCLMNNHYHLFLSPLVKNGVSKFMKKLNGGYANYFNKRYKRKGALFEGRFKSVIIKDWAHFLHIPYYIHLNPLDFIAPEWRDRKLNNFEQAWQYLENYRWSSHLDYLGKKNFPSIIQKDFLLEFFGDGENYKREIKNWLKNLEGDGESLRNLENLLE